MAHIGNTSNEIISMALANFPPEIIIEILVRLPVKILLKFKCVCKFFLSLISDPKFIKTHLKLSQKDPDLAKFRVIISSVLPNSNLKSCSLQFALRSEPDSAVTLHYPLKDTAKTVWIVGSFNGLVCINIEEDNLFIWNPSTRASKRLPDTGLELPEGPFKKYGFGFDECMDDYKVVGIFAILAEEMMHDTSITMMYSLRTNSWNMLGSFPIGFPVDGPANYANGSLHWAVTEGFLSNRKCYIVSLDLSNGTYDETEQPNYGAIDPTDLTLGVLSGCLCVIYNFKGLWADLWITKEYGVKSSWEKRCKIPYVAYLGEYWYSLPYWMASNGEILMEYGGVLVLYNANNGTFGDPKIRNLHKYLRATTYVESLVSPNFIDLVAGEEH